MSAATSTFGVKAPEGDPHAPFPIQRQGAEPARTVPRWVAAMAYAAYAHEYGGMQSLSRLAERGGFGPGEMDVFFPRWREFAP